MLKMGLVAVWLSLLVGVVGGLFWYNDWVYRLPTPVPVHYRHVPLKTAVHLNDRLKVPTDRPLFIHFFNPDCPCSRFNKAHFRSLVKQFSEDVQFAVVVMADRPFTADGVREKLGVNVPVYFDSTIAARCGVYSTPQAAIVDVNQSLYYRGNYNANRYCSDEKTAYAKIALTSLLNGKQDTRFETAALRSYGCSLPVCKN